MNNRRRIELIIYRFSDYLTAMLSWFLFFIYRKKVESPGIELQEIVSDPKLLYGLLFIPLFWVLLYSIFDKYKDIYRFSRLATLKRTLLICFGGVILLFFTVLIDDTVSIRKNSAYYERLMSLSNEIGGNIVIDTLDSSLSTAEIIDMVADGKIKYTVADENLAKINASYNPILKIDVPISFSQRIAWVTRKKAKKLRESVNDWIRTQRKETTYHVIYNKYFKNQRTFNRRIKSDYYSLNNNQISPYDALIKKYAKKIGWDWRLLASQIYQESRFDPEGESWAGAVGLMQIMPATAELLKVEDITDPEESIRGGTRYLDIHYKKFSDIPDSLNRIIFTLAAYNCGLGHVRDAQLLAEENGLNRNLWSDNVENMLLDLRKPQNFNKPFIKHGYVNGREPVNYIKQIFERYDHYKQFIQLE